MWMIGLSIITANFWINLTDLKALNYALGKSELMLMPPKRI
jgi:hypothetical protein